MIKPPKDWPLYAVVEDAPTTLVLENKAPRRLAAVATVILVPALIFGPFRFDQPILLGPNDVTWPARIFFGLIVLSGLIGAIDRQQIVFASGAVRFTSLVQPWKRLHRSLSEIEQVEVKTVTTTFYGEDNVKHHLYLVFRDKRRDEINRSTDDDFIKAVASRIEEFRT